MSATKQTDTAMTEPKVRPAGKAAKVRKFEIIGQRVTVWFEGDPVAYDRADLIDSDQQAVRNVLSFMDGRPWVKPPRKGPVEVQKLEIPMGELELETVLKDLAVS